MKKGVCLAFFILFASCQNENIVFEKNATIENASWHYNDQKSFSFEVDDLEQRYRLLIYLRHTKDYPNENVWLNSSTSFPSGEIVQDEIELRLAAKDGTWLGNGSGRVLTRELILRDTFTFTEKGAYEIKLAQHMRRNPVDHILDIGLRLEKVK